MIHLPREMIIASAGSGKTYTMSCRYIRLLTLGEPVRRVFASTFTRKAAGEILDRVLTMLAGAALDDAKCAELAAHADTPGLTRDGAMELLANVARELHTLNIGTLDSFFVRTARAFAYELGLPPAWGIASEPVDTQLRTEAIHRMLREDDPQPLVDLMRRVHMGDAGRSVHETLLSLVGELHAVYRQTHRLRFDPWVWFDAPDPRRVLSDEDLEALIEALSTYDVPLTKAGTPNKTWANALTSLADIARQREWESIAKAGLGKKVIDDDLVFSSSEIPGELVTKIRQLLAYASAVKVRALCEKTTAARDLVARFDREYQALKVARRAYRFEDITEMLGGGKLSGRLDELFYRLDGRIAHVLLDEFQDTSLQQWDALSPIADEVMQSDGDRATLIVADPKQSIYAWRGGEPALLDDVQARYALDERPLPKSYRSSPVIIDAVNDLFGDIAGNAAMGRYRDDAAAWSRWFTMHDTARRELPGRVRVVTAPATGDKPWGAAMRHAAEIARDLHAAAPGFSIGVLTRTNHAVRRVIYELRQMGVTCSEEGGNPLTDSVAVTAVLSLLTMADHPGDTAARFHVASTPVGAVVGFTDHADDVAAQRVAHDVRRRLLVEGYGDSIAAWAKDIAPSCDEAELKRLVQLVELACGVEAEATLRPGDFVRYVEATRVEDPTSADVRAMTVHASKGLEFDIVVLPELDKAMVGGGGLNAATMVHYRDAPTGPITRVFPRANQQLQDLAPACKEIMRQNESHQMRDSLGFLYVAVTRARHALHVVLNPERGRGTPLFADVVMEGLCGVDHRSARDAGGAVLHEAGEADWHVALERRIAAEAAYDEPECALAETGGRRLRGLGRTSPSQREGGRMVDVAQRLRLDAPEAMAYGTQVHEAMQRVIWADDDSAAALAAESAEVARVLGHAAVRDALSRTAYPADADIVVLNEHPFAVRDGDNVMTGFIDRLVLVRDKSTGRVTAAEVIDYKTDREIDVEHYRPQIEAYCEVVARMYGLDGASVTAKLLYVSRGEVWHVG